MFAYRLNKLVRVSLVKTAQDAFPTVGEAAAWVVLAMLEQGVEGAAVLAVIALDVKELLPEGVEVSGGKCLRVGHCLVPDVDWPGIMGSEGFQGTRVVAKRAAVVCHQDFRREQIGR